MADGFRSFEMGDDSDPVPASAPRTKKLLTVELVPESSFGNNLRSFLTRAGWDRVRKVAYRKAGYLCEVCGGKGPKHPVECHEVWEYDDEAHVQKLLGTTALCPTCHSAKHFGLAQMQGREDAAIRQLMKVNGWSRQQVLEHVHEQGRLWDKRSRHDWTLDLTWLHENYDIEV